MADFEEAIKNLYKLHSKKQKDTKGTKNKFDSKENFRGKKGFSDSGIPLTAKTQSKQKANKDRYAGRKGSYHFSPLKRINDAAAELGKKYRYKNPEHVAIVREAVEIAKDKIENGKKLKTKTLSDDQRSNRHWNRPTYSPDMSTGERARRFTNPYESIEDQDDGSVEVMPTRTERKVEYKNKVWEEVARLRKKYR